MDHQQSTILAMTETAKEASRVHIDMHNQIVAMEAEVAQLREALEGLLEYLAECTTRYGCPVCVARSAMEVKP